MAIILDGTNGISTPDVEPTGSTVPTNGLYLPAANSVGIATNSSERVRVNSSGNVGIGTSSPGAKLDVRGSSSFLINATNPTAWVSVDSALTTGSIYNQWNTSSNVGISGTYTNHPYTFVTNNTERMRIDTSGNVGIGTSSPRAKLEIAKSNDSASPSRTPTDYSILFTAAQANTYNNGIAVTESTYVNAAISPIDTGSGGAQGWSFITGNNTAIAEAARIDSSGRFYVNETGQISGYSEQAVIKSNNTNVALALKSSGDNNVCLATTNADGNTNQYYAAIFCNNGNFAGQTKGSITVTNSATAFNTSSDYRLKENIAPMKGALAKVAALNPVTYTWKIDGSAGEGFIAHELQAVVPDCVTGEKDAVDAEGKPQYQGIDTSFLVATLTAAIKEQQAIIEQLTTRIAALEAK